MKERTKFLWMTGVFLLAFYLPLGNPRVQSALLESFYMLQDYAQKHVLTCLVPAFFIAGAIANFVSQASVLKYFGAKANKALAYGVASISGTILADCSCTVLPLFAGIYTRGAGIGPATAFLYSGPAINILAIILTGRVLGPELGVARAVGAVVFAIVIGLLMHLIFLKEEREKAAGEMFIQEDAENHRSLAQYALYFATMVLILIFAAWSKPPESEGFFYAVFEIHWVLTAILLALLSFMLYRWFTKDELASWMDSSWGFAKQIFPLLLGGVMVAGFLMGRPEADTGIIPAQYIGQWVGGNSLMANFIASFLGAFMYFATLTEIPILQGLLGSGMGKGPALALLLAGPALSLPNMIVIHQIMGLKKTMVFVGLVIVMSTFSGMIFGTFWG